MPESAERISHVRKDRLLGAVDVEAAQETPESLGLGDVDQTEEQVLDGDEVILELRRLGLGLAADDGGLGLGLGLSDSLLELRRRRRKFGRFNWTLQLNVNNVFDEKVDIGNGYTWTRYTEPRQYITTATMAF